MGKRKERKESKLLDSLGYQSDATLFGHLLSGKWVDGCLERIRSSAQSPVIRGRDGGGRVCGC